MNKKRFSVLLAEDDLDDQHFLKIAFEEINPSISLTIAYDGVHALNFFLKKESTVSRPFELPKFIITDLNMPRLDGFDFIARIKKDPTLMHIPIFVLSTSADEKAKERALKLGAEDYYIKPLDLTQFKPIIEEMVSKVMQTK